MGLCLATIYDLVPLRSCIFILLSLDAYDMRSSINNVICRKYVHLTIGIQVEITCSIAGFWCELTFTKMVNARFAFSPHAFQSFSPGGLLQWRRPSQSRGRRAPRPRLRHRGWLPLQLHHRPRRGGALQAPSMAQEEITTTRIS